MTLEEVEERIFELEKARESDCPGTVGLEKHFFIEFIQDVANASQGPIKKMATCIFSQYGARMFHQEKEYNICQDAMNQIQKDVMNGTLIFNQEGDRKVFKGTDITVIYDKDVITIKKYS